MLAALCSPQSGGPGMRGGEEDSHGSRQDRRVGRTCRRPDVSVQAVFRPAVLEWEGLLGSGALQCRFPSVS